MNRLIREFHLSPRESGRGVSCDADGAFIGTVPLLKRLRRNGKDAWRLRDCEQLSEQISEHYGLPIDMSSKKGGLKVIASALNQGDVARAQIATVLLGIPDPPQLSKRACTRDGMITLIRDLHWSGLLKWDPDEHPRWPAGSSDGRGGEFAPKGEGDEPDGSSLSQSGRMAQTKPSRDGATDSIFTNHLNSASAAAQISSGGTLISELGDESQTFHGEDNPQMDEDGIYAEYGNHIGGVQLASASIPMGSIGIAGANPANWRNQVRLANGSLELGSGQIIAAAELLSAIDQSRERNAVRSAMTKFGLNPAHAADVLAARAYVWARTAAPWNFPDVPTSGAKLESVSRSIMQVELARPGTLYLALQGDRLSTAYLNSAAQEGMSDAAVLESRIRLANALAPLQSTSKSARAALNLQPNDKMQAHHLVPINIIADNLALATLASKAGWYTDGVDNLIALPADPQTQADLAERGIRLPMQRSAHPIYDAQTQKQIDALELVAGLPLTPMKARSIIDKVALENLRQILSREWDPMLKSS
jgi:hypothetical protein